jgi:ankyrin repeat protein
MSEQLLEAVRTGDVARAKELIAAGADAKARDSYGATALMNAAYAGNLEMVKTLIAAGGDVNATDELGWNAVHKAVYNSDLDKGFPEVVGVLAKAGCDVNARIGYGIRPLMLAAGYGEAAVCQVLLDNGADVLARNDGERQVLRGSDQPAACRRT